MAKPNILAASTKRLAIDKANARILLMVGIAAFIVVFAMVSSKALLDQRAYQAKVIGKKKIALKQLKANTEEVKKLTVSYQEFAGKTENALGGNPAGSGDKDGTNPKIVLDALPSKYDFPALATSLEKVLKDNQYQLEGIEGTDEELAQAANDSSVKPKPVEMPFVVDISTTSSASKPLFQLFERSIRPFQIQSINLKGETGKLKITINGKTYFQPKKNFNVKMEKVK